MKRAVISLTLIVVATGALAESIWRRVEDVRRITEMRLKDPTRPRYHFVIDGSGVPGDPNGAFWHAGRYHLMYLYHRPQGFCWGHASSADLLHWRRHADSLGVGPVDGGCYSGGGFVDDDGTAYLTYWMIDARECRTENPLGLGLARSRGPFETWEKFAGNPIVRSTHWGWTLAKDADGREVRYASADPSNIWKKGGRYFMAAGNLCLLNDNGRKPDSPAEMKGDSLSLFESSDLKTWTYRHPFYRRRADLTRAQGWTDDDEDCMCPCFLPLPRTDGTPSGKHLLLFISHNRGCQYYIGTYDTQADLFLPESHGRMTWEDKTYFAPEALLDGRGRLIVWTWLLDNRLNDFAAHGWSGVYALPRQLWLEADGTLGIRPADELERLRLNGRERKNLRLASGESLALAGMPGDCCEIEVVCDSDSAANLALDVRTTSDGATKTTIRYDAPSRRIVFDGTKSGELSVNSFCEHVPVERAPFELGRGESLRLRVFVDGPVVEVFANGRQAISRRVYPREGAADGVRLTAIGGPVTCRTLRTWEIMPSNVD